MPTLHAAPAPTAVTDVDVKGPCERSLYRQLFLILGRHARRAHRTRTGRTVRGQRRLVDLVNVRRPRPMRAASIRGSRLAAGTAGHGDSRAARERRGLAVDGPARRIELVSQLVVFAPQPLSLGFRPSQILFELLNAPRLVVNNLLRITRRGIIALRHAPVMPNYCAPYKKKKRVSLADPLT
jgi:hypothetical protein